MDVGFVGKLCQKNCFIPFPVTPQAKAAFFISISLTAMYILCGTVVLIDFSAEIFVRTESSISPKSSSLLVSVAKLAGNLIFLVIVEKFHRKVCESAFGFSRVTFYGLWLTFQTFFIGSTLASAVFFLLFGTYCLLWTHQPELDWMPAFCAACISFSSGMGLSQMPFLIGAEIFPKKVHQWFLFVFMCQILIFLSQFQIRSICISFTLCFLWLILFIIESIFPILLNHIGLSGCLFIFGTICLITTLIGSCIIPETRGKSYEEIMQMLAKWIIAH